MFRYVNTWQSMANETGANIAIIMDWADSSSYCDLFVVACLSQSASSLSLCISVSLVNIA